jgi:hypothetical protein
MELQKKINDDLKQSMIEKDTQKRDFLRVVIGEMNRIGKELTDNEIFKILFKMKENAEIMKNQYEISVLNYYLPKILSIEELDNIIKNIVKINNFNTIRDIGKIMNELKNNFPSQFDGNIASSIIKKYIQ